MFNFLLPLIYAPVFYFAFPELLSLTLFVVGLYLGVIVMWLDRQIGYRYYAEPGQPVQLITRSFLFVLVYAASAVFVITSSGSHLGTGMVQGIGLVLGWELFQLRRDPITLNALFFAMTKKQLTLSECQWLVAAFWSFFAITSVLVFIQ